MTSKQERKKAAANVRIFERKRATSANSSPDDIAAEIEARQALKHKDLDDSVLSWVRDFQITDEEAEAISDPEFIVDGLIVQGHLIAIPAPPGAGKTTIVFHLCGEMVRDGFQAIYINADISAADAKEMKRQADRLGIELLTPDLKVGLSMADVVENLRTMNMSGVNLDGVVFVCDTLKKMCSVIQKESVKILLNLMRSLTAKGATVILLAHTNKYLGDDGKPIFEGTGDIRSDVDELLYLTPEKHSDGSMTVSVEPDKTRAAIEKMTFEISPDREVKRLPNFVDVAARKAQSERMEMDRDVIERITEALISKHCKQCEIVEFCKRHSLTRKQVRICLDRYSNGDMQLWKQTRGFQNNTLFYELLPNTAPDGKPNKCPTGTTGITRTTEITESETIGF